MSESSIQIAWRLHFGLRNIIMLHLRRNETWTFHRRNRGSCRQKPSFDWAQVLLRGRQQIWKWTSSESMYRGREQGIGPKDLSAIFPPSLHFVTQVLRVQTCSSLSCFAQSFMAVWEGGHIQLRKFRNLENREQESYKKQRERYNVIGQTLRWCDYNTDRSFPNGKSSWIFVWMFVVFHEYEARNWKGRRFPLPVAVQQSMSCPSRIVEISSSCTGCSPFVHIGMSVFTMVLIVSRPIGSCQRALEAIFKGS